MPAFVNFSNPLDSFFVNLFSPLYPHPSIELFVAIVVNLIYFYGFSEMYFFLRTKDRMRALQLIATVAVGMLLVFSLKYYSDRQRPYQAFGFDVIETKTDPSFPSAHTFLAFVFYYFVTKIPRVRRFRLLFAAHLLIIVPLGVMITGVHYFTDVLVGAAIGFLLPKIFTLNVVTRIFRKFF